MRQNFEKPDVSPQNIEERDAFYKKLEEFFIDIDNDQVAQQQFYEGLLEPPFDPVILQNPNKLSYLFHTTNACHIAERNTGKGKAEPDIHWGAILQLAFNFVEYRYLDQIPLTIPSNKYFRNLSPQGQSLYKPVICIAKAKAILRDIADRKRKTSKPRAEEVLITTGVLRQDQMLFISNAKEAQALIDFLEEKGAKNNHKVDPLTKQRAEKWKEIEDNYLATQ